MNYYNEFDPYAAEWLRNLILEGLIPYGDVDDRDIRDVQPTELRGYTQCHFFAGIGGWSRALELAGWPPDRPVWTGSCPCQPFSAAGQRRGVEDERHLWPEFHRLISAGQPAIVFGEQVASADGRAWLAVVRSELEALGYAVGAADLCAASVGAPHIRQRLWFVADSHIGTGGQGGAKPRGWHTGSHAFTGTGLGRDGDTDVVADGERPGLEEQRQQQTRRQRAAAERGGEAGALAGELGDAGGPGSGRDTRGVPGAQGEGERERRQPGRLAHELVAAGSTFWSAVQWLDCRDGKARPVEPCSFPLAYGVPGRVGRLRAYGNAIVPQVAAAFIKAYLACRVM